MPPQGPPPRKKRTGLKIFLASIGTFVLLLIVVSVALNGSSNGTPEASSSGASSAAPSPISAPASQAAAPQPSPTPAAPDTVTFIVNGSPADVTYGPSGSDLIGTVPMSKTLTIPSSAPSYYAVSAQLQGDGTVSCQIQVDGKTISTATATGSYNIADCEISQDFTGSWQDTNSG